MSLKFATFIIALFYSKFNFLDWVGNECDVIFWHFDPGALGSILRLPISD